MSESSLETKSQPNAARNWSRTDYITLASICMAAAVVVLPGLAAFGIIDPSDGLYSEGAREMMEMKNFITPHYNYLPFYEKPIMLYWMMIASYSVFGVHEWAARVPSALCAISTCGVVFSLSRFFISRDAAVFSALVLITSPLFAVVGMLALTDMPLCFFLTTTMLALFQRLHGGTDKILWLGYASLGCAVLTKGPLPVVLTAMVFIAYFALTSGDNLKKPTWYIQSIKQLEPLKGMALTLAIALPWYVLETVVTHGDFFQEFFIRQNLGRLGGAVNHVAPFWFYIPVVLVGTCPWIAFQFLVPQMTKQLLQRRSITFPANAMALFCLCWSVIVFIFLSAVKTKLATYILPVVPPLALMVGMHFDRWGLTKPRKSLFTAGVSIASLLFVSAGIMPMISDQLPQKMTDGRIILLLIGIFTLAVGWIVFSFRIWQSNVEQGFRTVLCTSVIGMALLIPTSISVFDKIEDQPLRELIKKAQQANARLSTFTRTCTAAPFYLKESVPMISNEQEYQTFLHDSDRPHWILASKDVVPQLLVHPGEIRLVDHKGKWSLFSLK
ncbi:MAG TPA: glycosyltransferase family 39 protein [Drouetiella sp.]